MKEDKNIYHEPVFELKGDNIVKKNSTLGFKLLFSPKWVGEYKASFLIKNNTTLEVTNYNIIGRAIEPRAEKVIKIKGKARQNIPSKIFVLNNDSVDRTFNVESDLVGIKGDSSFVLKSHKSTNYEFSMFSYISGNFTGQITFTDDQGKYWW